MFIFSPFIKEKYFIYLYSISLLWSTIKLSFSFIKREKYKLKWTISINNILPVVFIFSKSLYCLQFMLYISLSNSMGILYCLTSFHLMIFNKEVYMSLGYFHEIHFSKPISFNFVNFNVQIIYILSFFIMATIFLNPFSLGTDMAFLFLYQTLYTCWKLLLQYLIGWVLVIGIYL